MNLTTDFDGCGRGCRNLGTHTKVYGECAYGEPPPPAMSIAQSVIASDGYRSIVIDRWTRSEVVQIIEEAMPPGIRHTTYVGQVIGFAVDGLFKKFAT